MKNPWAVVLSGCGHLDGAEIRESVLTFLALESQKIPYESFAPNQNQHQVVDHLTAQGLASQERNVLQEAARLARGKVVDLEELDSARFEGLVLPGGFGVAQNLSSIGALGARGTVLPPLQRAINGFYQEKKPIVGICVAPVLLALCLGAHGIEVTIGNDENTAKEIEKTGARHHPCQTASEFWVDEKNRVVTTPAYMFDGAPLPQIHQGISQAIERACSLVLGH